MNVASDALDDLLARVDAERLMASVKTISKETREPGSAGEAKAFAFLADQLKKLGLKPRLFYEKAYVSLPRKAALEADGQPFACRAHSMTPSARVAAEIVYVPPDDRSRADGKIVLLDGLATAGALNAAAERGAVGAIFISGKRIHEMIASDVWGSPSPDMRGAYPKIPAVSVNREDGEKLKRMLEEHTPRAVLRAEVENTWIDLPILTADLKSGKSRDYLLLSGHVDSWHQGALDNASGLAAALEIARIIGAERQRLSRGIKFAFWSGHSHGRYAGSAAFSDACFQDLYDHCFLHINVDCLGSKGATVLTQAACMAETKALGAAAIGKVAGVRLEGARFGRSCDQSFWGTGSPSLFSSVSEQPPAREADAATKAFALMFGGGKSGGFGWWWHTTADTWEMLDPENLKRDCRIFLAAAYWATALERIPFALTCAADELIGALKRRAASAKHFLDFSDTLAAAEKLRAAVARIERQKHKFSLPKDIAAYNRFVMEYERIVVPLNYVKGSAFDHDPAIRLPPLPLLQEVDRIRTATDEFSRQSLRVYLRRRLNQVHCQIRRAIDLADRFAKKTARV